MAGCEEGAVVDGTGDHPLGAVEADVPLAHACDAGVGVGVRLPLERRLGDDGGGAQPVVDGFSLLVSRGMAEHLLVGGVEPRPRGGHVLLRDLAVGAQRDGEFVALAEVADVYAELEPQLVQRHSPPT